MTVRYADGRTTKGFILSRNDMLIRVAVEGGENTMVLACVNGTWISDVGAPVEIEFEWQRHPRKETTSESAWTCPEELAARLIQVLLSYEEELPFPGRDRRPTMQDAGISDIQSVN